MSAWLRLLVLLLALSSSACVSLSGAQRERAAGIAAEARSTEIVCGQANACALESPLHDLGPRALSESTGQAPRHYALMLDSGQDALLARLNLIRSARRTIDLQTYIFDKDDSARMVLDELLEAARRGVQVRVLIDQLAAITDVEILAALAGAHRNFSIRVYNPTFGKANPNYLDYAGSVLCCFRRFNQRMHTKLLLVDGHTGITGGRNYQDDYFDWDAEYNFRDRDVLVAGPASRAMAENFEAFWQAPRTVAVERLNDVGRLLLRGGVPVMPPKDYLRPDRVEAMSASASDPAQVQSRLVQPAMAVGRVEYVADLPQKHLSGRDGARDGAPAVSELETLIANARSEVLLQTPYLVLSGPARELFAALHQREQAPRVIVSTNSLAATDNPLVYSMSFKYKRRNMREYGFEIHEYKPFPADAPFDFEAMAGVAPMELEEARARARQPLALGSSGYSRTTTRRLQRAESRPSFFSSGASTAPLPLKSEGVRIGLHAKSMVVDDRIAVIGTHNFDPRSEHYNTESAVIIDDARFARLLGDSIRRDIAPANSWTVAPRSKPPVLSGIDYSLGKVSEALPLFDLWPFRYATSYEFRPGPGCMAPVPYDDPAFDQCYESVGDFPEVNVGPKWLYTRLLTAFGAGLIPIL